jgi:prepilin-type N-terminal cleavage/methylation domain-containing protein
MRKLTKKTSHNQKNGFTLLEMIVAVGIFAVAAVIAVGALVRITGLNRQAQTLQTAMNNAGFALESMSREIRVGTRYQCAPDLGSINWSGNAGSGFGDGSIACKYFAFNSSVQADRGAGASCNLVYVYSYTKDASNHYKINKAKQTECDDVLNDTKFSSILDDTNLTLENYDLRVKTKSRGYSWVTISLSGYAGKRDTDKTHFSVRTGVSQRMAD